MDVLSAVRENIENRQLLEAGTTVVVGVSGGSDSLCLLHVLRRLSREFDLNLHVSHLNHCLRGEEADADMVFVVLLAMEWGLPCTVEVANVSKTADQRHLSLEEASRQVRYGFLLDVARREGASAVAVGHNADDQSETVLMHFLRGAGLAGLRGMLPWVILDNSRVIRDSLLPSTSTVCTHLIRPLLSVPRVDIETYCREHNLAPRFDRSNLDTTIFRNRIRHQLLPLLETYNPNIKASLQRTASVAAADYELLAAKLKDTWARIVIEGNENCITFDLPIWRTLPLALQRATLRNAAYRLRPQLRDVDFVHIRQAINTANTGPTGAQATLPKGLRLTVGYRTLQLAVEHYIPPAPDWPLLWHNEPVPVTLPGKTPLPNNRQRARAFDAPGSTRNSDDGSEWWLEADLWHGELETVVTNPDRWTAYLDLDRLGPNPVLRRRRPGDRFWPLGMGGRAVKIADFLVNAKVPRHWREHIPLLVHRGPHGVEAEAIAWLVGWRIDERVKATQSTRRTILLRCVRRPAPGTFESQQRCVE